MAHDVFISYSTENKSVANEILSKLENRKIRCWIAPRDIPPGMLYGASLINAIKSAQVMVLVLSEGTNHSEYVVRELNEAVANGLTIISFRIEEVEPSENLGFYINSTQWLNAIEPPMETHLNKLADSVTAILSVERKEDIPNTETVYEAQVKKRWPLPTWVTALLVLAAALIISGGGYWLFSQMGSGINSTSPTETTFPTQAVIAEDIVESTPDVAPILEIESDWRPLTFITPKPKLWKESDENSYITVGQHSMDAFAWSTESFEGDLIISLDLQRLESESDGCIIVYGDGKEHYSQGSLIFCVSWDGYILNKHTIYHEGEDFLAYINHNNDTDELYMLKIEITDDLANMYVDEELVLSSFFDLQEINRKGRIGLFKPWYIGELIFSNIQINTNSD